MICALCRYEGGTPSDHEPWCPVFMRGAIDLEEQLELDDATAGDLLDDAIAEQTGLHPADPPEAYRPRTRRERLEARAERRRDWAASREAKSEAAHERARSIMDTIPLGQPILVGHHSERRHRRDLERIESNAHAFVEHARMAEEHESKAAGIEAQLAGAIYSDDVDAVERLEARIVELEAERDRWKRYNASCKRGTPDETELDERQRETVETIRRHVPYQLGRNGEIGYTNLSANIRRNRERLEQIKRDMAARESGDRGRGRAMLARFSSSCDDCGATIEKGSPITYYRTTREAICASCSNGR